MRHTAKSELNFKKRKTKIMTNIKTEYDSYTNKKLLINLVEDIFKIDNIEFGRIDGLKYAILTINGGEYITYSNVILNQLKIYEVRNVLVTLKEQRVSEFSKRKYHKLCPVSEGLL